MKTKIDGHLTFNKVKPWDIKLVAIKGIVSWIDPFAGQQYHQKNDKPIHNLCYESFYLYDEFFTTDFDSVYK